MLRFSELIKKEFPKVLVIEDDLHDRLTIKNLLSRSGMNVGTTPDGPAAFEVLKDFVADVILVAQSIPESHQALLLALDADPRTAGVPSITIAKPLMPDDLLERLRAALRLL